METLPVTVKSIGSNWGVDGKTLERAYKDHLSDFRSWEQLEHASNWMLLPQNSGVRLSIDESSFCNDLFTILSDKEGHVGKGTIVAMVRGTKASDVINILLNLPEDKRLAVTKNSIRSLRGSNFMPGTQRLRTAHCVR
jgi:hypothetical protein